MRPVKTELSNTMLVGEGCEDLPCFINEFHPDGHAVETVWELEDDEIIAIMETKRIKLVAMGRTQPPVYMLVVRVDDDEATVVKE